MYHSVRQNPNPRMYRKNHPFTSRYSQKNTPKELSAKQLREKLGRDFIRPLSAPTSLPTIDTPRVTKKLSNKNSSRKKKKISWNHKLTETQVFRESEYEIKTRTLHWKNIQNDLDKNYQDQAIEKNKKSIEENYWKIHWSKKHKREYWWNSKTGKSIWVPSSSDNYTLQWSSKQNQWYIYKKISKESIWVKL